MQSKSKRAPLLSRICFTFGAFVLGGTYLIAEGALRVVTFESGSWSFKAVVWVVGLATSLAFFALGSKCAEARRSRED